MPRVGQVMSSRGPYQRARREINGRCDCHLAGRHFLAASFLTSSRIVWVDTRQRALRSSQARRSANSRTLTMAFFQQRRREAHLLRTPQIATDEPRVDEVRSRRGARRPHCHDVRRAIRILAEFTARSSLRQAMGVRSIAACGLHGLHERHLEAVFAHEPNLKLVAADHVADEQVVRSFRRRRLGPSVACRAAHTWLS